MFIHVGVGHFGKVDRVPGLFHVKTQFMHVWYFPLVPTGSFLCLEGTAKRRGPASGHSIPLSMKSVLVAWARALTLVMGVVGALYVVGYLILSLELQGRNLPMPFSSVFWYWGGLSVLCFFLYWLSFRFCRARPIRALRLAAVAGISPEALARHFVDAKDLPEDGYAARAP
jgi:hypothetical protein